MKTLSKNTQPRPQSNLQSSSPSTPTNRPWPSKLGWLWLVVFGLLGVYLLTQRNSHQASSSSSARSVSSRGSDTATSMMPRVGTRPIETLQVGDRVLAFNPELSHAERKEIVEPLWWDLLHLSLSMPKADGSLLEIELLRPEKWVREQIRLAVAPQAAELFNGKPQATVSDHVTVSDHATPSLPKPELQDLVPLSPLRPIFLELAAVGAELELSGEELQALFVEMDLPELAITGPAVVKQIQNAPTIVVDHSVVLGSSATQPQAGRVITARFKHSSGDVIDLRVGDASEPRITSNTTPIVRVAHRPNELGSANSAAALPAKDAAERAEAIGSSDSDDSIQVIGTTSNHPFWSVDRREYVQAGKLELGERVLTYSGDTKRVLSKLARPGPQPVYNLEVFAEHVYYVGKDGVLVHNAQGYNVLLLGLEDHLGQTGKQLNDLGLKTTSWLQRMKFTEIAEAGRAPFTGPNAAAVQWKTVQEAISNSDGIVFNLKGMDIKKFQAFLKSGYKVGDDVPSKGNWTNAELHLLLTQGADSKTLFLNGNLKRFRQAIKEADKQ